MKILIVGLGLMGGAYAYRLKDKGHFVYGYDINNESMDYALSEGFINAKVDNLEDIIPNLDLIIISIYPKQILAFIDKYKYLFNANLYITDIAGVKSSFLLDAQNLAKPAKYISHHPMAGREKIGIRYAKECNFSGANFLITTTKYNTNEDINFMKSLGTDLGFKNITSMDYLKQDKMISYTSALAHAIAVALVNSNDSEDTKDYIGDSYRDLTRIAMINETLWSELFLENKDNLIHYISVFEDNIDQIKCALISEDKKRLEELFIKSTKIRGDMNK